MSTKIYNGYRLPASTNLAAMARDINTRAAVAFRPLALRAVAAVAAALIADPDDLEPGDALADALRWLSADQVTPRDIALTRFGHARTITRVAEIVDCIQTALDRFPARRVPIAVDLKFSYAVMDDPGDDQWLYAMLFTDRPEFTQVFTDTPGVEQFSYWDNSDQPDDVDDQQWERRGQIWKRVLPDYTPPARVAVMWEFAPQNNLAIETLRGLREQEPLGWLTVPAVLDVLRQSSTSEALFDANRDELSQRLHAKAPAIAPEPRMTGSTVQFSVFDPLGQHKIVKDPAEGFAHIDTLDAARQRATDGIEVRRQERRRYDDGSEWVGPTLPVARP